MTWHLSHSVDEFLDAAGDWLRARPVRNTVLLTVAAGLRLRGPHVYGPGDPVHGWHHAGTGPVDGAFLHTPPHPVLLSALPPGAATALAETLAGRDVRAVNGLTADATAFAAEVTRRTGATARPRKQNRLYRLDVLTPPSPPVPGAARIADASDHELLSRWWAAFHEEIGEPNQTGNALDERLTYGGLTLWETGGQPVSMAAVSRPEAGMIRVTTVYTPPGHRGHGYAAAATAAVTRAARETGAAEVVLNTDVANPTSNALYQRLGYRPVEDRTVMEFAA